MLTRKAMALAAISLSTLAGCGLAGCGGDTLPGTMVGSFARDDTAALPLNQRMHLYLTPTGMSVTAPTMAAAPGTTGEAPAAGGSAKKISSGSALFKKVSCTEDSSCRFTTENGCDGTFTRDATRAVTIVATGECESWSGKWNLAKEGDPAASPSPAATDGSPSATALGSVTVPAAQPPATATTPQATGTATGTAAPTATASGTPTTSGLPTALPTTFPSVTPKMSCLAACQDTNLGCVGQCKVGDLTCISACSDKVVQCAQKCP